MVLVLHCQTSNVVVGLRVRLHGRLLLLLDLGDGDISSRGDELLLLGLASARLRDVLGSAFGFNILDHECFFDRSLGGILVVLGLLSWGLFLATTWVGYSEGARGKQSDEGSLEKHVEGEERKLREGLTKLVCTLLAAMLE
jgi:hypothetical protein